MFLIPLIVLPLIFILAVNRLYKIPVALWAGRLQVPAHRRLLLSVVSAAAYLMLMAYTIALSAALVRAVLFSANRFAAYLPLVGYVFAYPLVYLAAAWIFYYGLKPVPGADALQADA